MTMVEVDEVESRWADVLDSVVTKRGYALAPWQPLSGENRLAFMAFRVYLDSPTRNVAQVAATLSLGYDDLMDMSSEFGWSRRSTMFDEFTDRQGDAVRTEAVRRVGLDNAQAFAKLADIVGQAQTLVLGALNGLADKQARAAANGEEVPHLSMSMAMKVADTMRQLMAETNRFLGVKVDVVHTVQGTVRHRLEPSDKDALDMLRGLQDANLIPLGTAAAIEASVSE